jgi:iron-sulfur cluster repair protein YtfE (RIC family)
MEFEHNEAGIGLPQLQQQTDDFLSPELPCNIDCSLLETLLTCVQDTHQQVHQENNVLFLQATALEHTKA